MLSVDAALLRGPRRRDNANTCIANLIASVLFDLGTPEINGEPTPDRVRRWVAELDTAVP